MVEVKNMVSGTAEIGRVLGKTSQTVRDWEKAGRLSFAERDYNGRLQAPLDRLLEYKAHLEAEKNGR